MKILSIIAISSLFVSLNALTLKEDNTQSSLVIYNSNIALVHEERVLDIKKDETKIIYEDVASSINTDSVNVVLPQDISIFSQQYRFDKLTQRKLLDAHIGKKIDVRVKDNAKNYQTISAILLSNDGVKCIVKTDSKIIVTVDTKNIIFKEIPEDLITKPSLVWNISSDAYIKSTIKIDYLINNINWKSNYILKLKDDTADLTGWITIDNRSGKSFKDTDLHVLAGDINKVSQVQPRYMRQKSMAVMADSSVNVSHQAHEGYHFYTIPFKVSLSNNEKTQVKFIQEKNIDVKRKYSAKMYSPNHLKGEINHDVVQYVTFSGLKNPLPKGVVRSYSKLKKTNILLGESSLKHTPKDTPISLKLGKNFDVKVKETLVNFDDTKWQTNVDIKYTIKNSSKETKTVEILVPFNRNEGSKVTCEEKYEYTKGNLVTFNIEVQAESTQEFKVHFKTKK